MSDSDKKEEIKAIQEVGRRSFLTSFSFVAMAGGLLASYGTFAGMAVRFLYPARKQKKSWMFVTDEKGMKPGESIHYQTPAGEKVSITRRGNSGSVDDFIALSSTCPHLGCQVHWESQNKRYFCPCHNGIFDPAGKATGGPPSEAGQSLPQYPLKIEKGLLFIEVGLETLS